MIYSIIFLFVVIYLIEVVFGSCTSVHNSESGFESECDNPSKISNLEFFKIYVPIFAFAISIFLMFYNNI